MAALHSAGPPPVGPPPADSLARLALGTLSGGRANSAPHSVFQYLPAGLEQVGAAAILAGLRGGCPGGCRRDSCRRYFPAIKICGRTREATELLLSGWPNLLHCVHKQQL